jgi:sialate O-acetylesterase
MKAMGDDLYGFSAAGYFTAKDLKDRYKIPIGLMQTAVGGTPAKSWCSEAAIRKMGYYTDELELCKKPGYIKEVEAFEQAREQAWYQEAKESFDGMPLKKGTIQIPGIWRENEFANFHGTMRLTKQFYMKKEELKIPAEILLGTINDADVVYINGIYIGETGYKYPPRIYSIPDGVLKEGWNTVEIHLSIYREHGGFMPGKQYCIRLGKQYEVYIGLGGEWEYELMKPMKVLENSTFFTYYPAALYNGMLSPVRKWKYTAFLYYQGESNTILPERYVEEMEALIGGFRNLFQQELPFIYVQLAGFSDGREENQSTEWAVFRAAQEKSLAVDQTAMVVAYDLGEYNDLHPLDKKTLGHRMALAIRKLSYQEDVIFQGPFVSEIEVKEEGKVQVAFDGAGTGLEMRGREVCEVELMDANGTYYPASATIEGEKLIASSIRVKEPKGIRFAWRDCPMNANLYNKEGLPAWPFCREWE